jgi:2'-5' RNA ligase/ribosomal protein S18 acetylase RimI-like enzyme
MGSATPMGGATPMGDASSTGDATPLGDATESRDEGRRRRRRRLTVSLVATGPVADEVNGIRRALGAAELTRIPPHVTLVPTVNVSDDDLQAACDLARQVAGRTKPLHLKIGPAATFMPRNPVCYLAVSADPATLMVLQTMFAALNTGPLAPPANRKHRPYAPHMTINQRMAPELIADAVTLLSSYTAELAFEKLTVLEYHQDERVWRPLAEHFFEGVTVVGRGGCEVELSMSARPDRETAEWAETAWRRDSLERYGVVFVDSSFVVTARVAGAGGGAQGSIAGVAEAVVRGAACRLAALIVGTAERGQGVGTKLLAAVEQEAASRGCKRVRLETIAGSPAEAFYRGRGYEVVTALPLYRNERDFVMMQRALR